MKSFVISHQQAMRLKSAGKLEYHIRWVGGRGNTAHLEPPGEESYRWCLREVGGYPEKHGWRVVGEAPEWLKELVS